MCRFFSNEFLFPLVIFWVYFGGTWIEYKIRRNCDTAAPNREKIKSLGDTSASSKMVFIYLQEFWPPWRTFSYLLKVRNGLILSCTRVSHPSVECSLTFIEFSKFIYTLTQWFMIEDKISSSIKKCCLKQWKQLRIHQRQFFVSCQFNIAQRKLPKLKRNRNTVRPSLSSKRRVKIFHTFFDVIPNYLEITLFSFILGMFNHWENSIFLIHRKEPDNSNNTKTNHWQSDEK